MAAPWIKFWPADWRSSSRIRRLTMAERGCFLELICADHEADGLPGDWPTLRLELPVQADEEMAMRLLHEFFDEGEDGLWRSPKRVREQEISRVRSRAGRKGGKANGKQKPKQTASKSPSKSGSKPPSKTPSPEARTRTRTRRENQNHDDAPPAPRERGGEGWPPEAQVVFDAWRVFHPDVPPAPSSSSWVPSLLERVENGWEVDAICDLVAKAHRLPFYTGQNETGQTFLSLDYLLRPGELEKIAAAVVPNELADFEEIQS